MTKFNSLPLYLGAICLSACATGNSITDYRKAHFDNLPAKNARLDARLADREPADCDADILSQTNKEAKPLVRIPPMMPMGASTSGTCKMKLDINAVGRPVNIKTLECTDEIFDYAARVSVSKWLYAPLVIGDKAVASCGIETKITFVLTNAKGERI